MEILHESSDYSDQDGEAAPKRSRTADSDNPKFTHPTTRTPLKRKTIQHVEIKNNYNYLNPDEQINEEVSQSNDKKPPPIVVLGVFTNHTKKVNEIKGIVKGKFFMKYGVNDTTIYCDKIEDRDKIFEFLEKNDIQCHTYTPRHLKTHAFTLRGLEQDPDVAEIKEELAHDNVPVMEIYKMKGTKSPTFMVVTDNI